MTASNQHTEPQAITVQRLYGCRHCGTFAYSPPIAHRTNHMGLSCSEEEFILRPHDLIEQYGTLRDAAQSFIDTMVMSYSDIEGRDVPSGFTIDSRDAAVSLFDALSAASSPAKEPVLCKCPIHYGSNHAIDCPNSGTYPAKSPEAS